MSWRASDWIYSALEIGGGDSRFGVLDASGAATPGHGCRLLGCPHPTLLTAISNREGTLQW